MNTCIYTRMTVPSFRPHFYGIWDNYDFSTFSSISFRCFKTYSVPWYIMTSDKQYSLDSGCLKHIRSNRNQIDCGNEIHHCNNIVLHCMCHLFKGANHLSGVGGEIQDRSHHAGHTGHQVEAWELASSH